MKRLLPAGLALIPLALVGHALRGGGALFGVDVALLFNYNRAAVGDALAHGRLPVWDPHVACGFPLLAAAQSAVFYPLTWPAAVLSPEAFCTASMAVHMWLAGVFAYAWLRALALGRTASGAGAVAFMTSGWLVTNVYGGHLPHVSTYAWLPAMLWRLERLLQEPGRARVVAFAAAVAMALLAGFPQIAFMGLLAVVARTLAARSARALGHTAAGLVLAAALAAPQLLPTIELITQAQRTTAVSFAFLSEQALAPSGLVTLVLPTALGDSVSTPYRGGAAIWEACGYVGAAGLLLAALGLARGPRRRWLWAALALLGLLLALGAATPVFPIAYRLVPGVGLFRVPGRYLVLFTLAMTPLVALGVERLAQWRRAAAAAAACVLLAELTWFGARYFVGLDPRGLPWPPPFVDWVRAHPGRIASSGDAGLQDAGRCQRAGLEHVGAYDALLLRRYTELMNVISGQAPDRPMVGSSPGGAHPVLDMLGVRWQLARPGDLPAAWPSVGPLGDQRVYESPGALPRAYVVPDARVIADPAARLAALAAPGFAPSREVILEEPAPAGAPGGGGRATVNRSAPGRYVIDVEGTGGWLVLAEAWYPGWSATIDGVPSRVVRANHLVQAIALPAGAHRAVFEYRSRWLGTGVALCVGALLAGALLTRGRGARNLSGFASVKDSRS